jgi:hypothetical protein
MPDPAISPDETTDESSDGLIPVNVDTLAIDRVAPQVGDPVSFTIDGTVEQVVNGVASVRPERVNGEPIPETKAVQQGDDMNALRGAAGEYDRNLGAAL